MNEELRKIFHDIIMERYGVDIDEAVFKFSTQNYASQLNAVFEALKYPLPSREEQDSKKAKPLAPRGKSLSERGNGSMNTQSRDKPSVKERLEALKEASEIGKNAPVRTKDRVR